MAERRDDGTRLRVLAVANFDSFLRAADLIGRELADTGADVEIALLQTRDEQISAAQLERAELPFPISHFTMKGLCAEETLARFDVFVMALDGSAFRRFFLRMADRTGPRPLVVAVYPGVVLRYHFDGLASRAPADFLWLNSAEDLSCYREMCSAFGVEPSNGRAFGLPALLSPVHRLDKPEKSIVFAEQVVIPRSRTEREYLAQQLIAMARRWPAYRLMVKPRHRFGEFTLHRNSAHIETLLQDAAARSGGWPENLEITHQPIERLLATCALCVTISSTVAIQAVHAGVPTAIVADFGAHDDHGLPFFFGSGLIMPFTDIDPDRPGEADAEWRDRRLLDPRLRLAGHVDELIAAARANREDLVPPRSLAPLVFGAALERDLRNRFDLDRLGARSFNAPRGWARRVLGRFARSR